jgi:hypothetical protein
LHRAAKPVKGLSSQPVVLLTELPLSSSDAIDAIYESLKNDNFEIDLHIKALKAALADEGLKEAVFDPERIAQNNRQGRKTMQAYFKKRGVVVTFGGA